MVQEHLTKQARDILRETTAQLKRARRKRNAGREDNSDYDAISWQALKEEAFANVLAGTAPGAWLYKDRFEQLRELRSRLEARDDVSVATLDVIDLATSKLIDVYNTRRQRQAEKKHRSYTPRSLEDVLTPQHHKESAPTPSTLAQEPWHSSSTVSSPILGEEITTSLLYDSHNLSDNALLTPLDDLIRTPSSTEEAYSAPRHKTHSRWHRIKHRMKRSLSVASATALTLLAAYATTGRQPPAPSTLPSVPTAPAVTRTIENAPSTTNTQDKHLERFTERNTPKQRAEASAIIYDVYVEAGDGITGLNNSQLDPQTLRREDDDVYRIALNSQTNKPELSLQEEDGSWKRVEQIVLSENQRCVAVIGARYGTEDPQDVKLDIGWRDYGPNGRRDGNRKPGTNKSINGDDTLNPVGMAAPPEPGVCPEEEGWFVSKDGQIRGEISINIEDKEPPHELGASIAIPIVKTASPPSTLTVDLPEETPPLPEPDATPEIVEKIELPVPAPCKHRLLFSIGAPQSITEDFTITGNIGTARGEPGTLNYRLGTIDGAHAYTASWWGCNTALAFDAATYTLLGDTSASTGAGDDKGFVSFETLAANVQRRNVRFMTTLFGKDSDRLRLLLEAQQSSIDTEAVFEYYRPGSLFLDTAASKTHQNRWSVGTTLAWTPEGSLAGSGLRLGAGVVRHDWKLSRSSAPEGLPLLALNDYRTVTGTGWYAHFAGNYIGKHFDVTGNFFTSQSFSNTPGPDEIAFDTTGYDLTVRGKLPLTFWSSNPDNRERWELFIQAGLQHINGNVAFGPPIQQTHKTSQDLFGLEFGIQYRW
ncbi:hypothetical protein D6783_03325 [Candidatus Woesearchaeota archaeon]|nr:MAG: hypothetical protein D6783_03325 [Candidatus Woesearchaeota archaeon]